MKKWSKFAVQTINKGNLYAVQYDNDELNCFDQCFENWNNSTYLEEFFENNGADLKINVEEAIEQAQDEADGFEADILAYAGGEIPGENLDGYIFVPLHESDNYDVPLQQSKAYGTGRGKCLLRLYAIRLEPDCYLVTGGTIKLTRTMQERPHTNEELERLKSVARFLRDHNMYDSFDIGVLITE